MFNFQKSLLCIKQGTPVISFAEIPDDLEKTFFLFLKETWR